MLKLNGDKIKLDEKNFELLSQLSELHLPTVDYANESSIWLSLKNLEILELRDAELLDFHRLAELVQLKELGLKFLQSNLDYYREMLYSEEHINLDPTNDDNCYFILNDLTNLTRLDLSQCHLTCINKKVLDNLKHLKYLNLSNNCINQIADDTFDKLVNL